VPALIDRPEAAHSVLAPLRRRLLGELKEPESAAGLARRLGLPRQKLNYHLRELERHGLVEQVGERRKGGLTERLVRATARTYVFDPELLSRSGEDPERARDRFSADYLMAAAAGLVRELATVRERADRADKRVATLTLEANVRFASAADRAACMQELTTAFTAIVSRYHDEHAPNGRTFRLLLGAWPAITKPATESSEESP
jgi:DNA-binding transcriptional ArsR family regulator